ncbi:MAG: rRNA maturation RNase YbeY [Chloroflexi bacterium]|nr:rRNA maturation RNase YbeY [Chloroflexota bacterium]
MGPGRHELAIELDGALPAELRGAAEAAGLRELLGALLDEEGVGRAALSLRLCDDLVLRELNRSFRGIDEPTDVLSFPLEEEAQPGGVPFPTPAGEREARELGDIAISVERAALQARQAGRPLSLELRHLALHGALHLLGHDHESPAGERALRAREERHLGAAIHDGPEEAPGRPR